MRSMRERGRGKPLPCSGVVGLDGGCHEGFFVGSGSGMVAVQPYVALLKVLVGAAFALDSLAMSHGCPIGQDTLRRQA